MKKLNKKGFTLVELLAVIVILALLMVVAASTVGNVQENAKKNTLKTEAQKLINSVFQEAQSEVMLKGNYATDTNLKYGSDGKYTYSVTVNKLGQVTYYCVNYNTEMSISESITASSASPKVGASEDVELSSKSGYCTVNPTDGKVTVK